MNHADSFSLPKEHRFKRSLRHKAGVPSQPFPLLELQGWGLGQAPSPLLFPGLPLTLASLLQPQGSEASPSGFSQRRKRSPACSLDLFPLPLPHPQTDRSAERPGAPSTSTPRTPSQS